MSKNMRYATNLVYLLAAVLFFAAAWLSLRNFCKVTESYEITASLKQLERESDYRFYQFVPAIGDVQVQVEGGDRPAVVTIEKAGYGTVVMIEGYGIRSGQMQSITIHYRLNPLRMKSELPPMDRYSEWACEFNAWSNLALAGRDRGLQGKSAMLLAEYPEPDYNMSLRALLSTLACTLSGFGMILFCLLRFRIHPTCSSEYAVEQLNRIHEQMGPKQRMEAEALAVTYVARYFKMLGWHGVAYAIGMFVLAVVILVWGEGSKASLAVLFLLIFVVYLINVQVSMRIFRQFISLMTEKCQPYAAVIALLMPFGTKQRIRIGRGHYGYLSAISTCFYYMGEFQAAYHDIGIIWDENMKRFKNKNTVQQLHFRTLRLYCLRELGEEEKAEAELTKIEECLKRHPGWEKHTYAGNYREQENILNQIQKGQYDEARELLRKKSDESQPRYLQVSFTYQLWTIARLEGDTEAAARYEAFIAEYGKDMFYYARINSEQQRSGAET